MARFTSKDIARFKASRAAQLKKAGNDNDKPARKAAHPRAAYVNTTMTPEMERAAAEAAGLLRAA